MNAVEKINTETPIFKLGKGKQSQEARKVSVDDGFTAIPNELLKAILRSKVLGWKGSYLLATILKTLSWHKESDWFTHSQVCEMMGIEPTKYHINQLSAARKELIKERVLFEDGKKTGVNLDVFSWQMVNPEKVGSSRNNRESVPEIVGNEYPEKVGNTKETITKEKINNTPLPPKGGDSASENLDDKKILMQAKMLLEYYNEQSGLICRSAEPFVKLLTKTTGREAFEVEDIKLVIRWALAVWKRQKGKPKPKNICRVTRFDGYVAEAELWQNRPRINYQAVIDAYNEILGDRLVPMDELDDLAIKQIDTLMTVIEKKNIEAFRAYFYAFANNAKSFYFEPERKLGFSFLMNPEILIKTRRGEI